MNGLHRIAVGFIAAASILVFAVPGAAQDGNIVIPEIGAELVDILFFEGVDPIPPHRMREYATSFNPYTARHIHVEIELRHPELREAPRDPIFARCTYYDPDGDPLMQPVDVPLTPEVSWTGVAGTASVGWDEPGGPWEYGLHRVTCTHGGRTIAEGSFRMEDVAPVVPSAELHFVEIRIFETGFDIPDEEDRWFDYVFDADETRYLGLQIRLRRPDIPLERDTELPTVCYFMRDDGTEIERDSFTMTMREGWRGLLYTHIGPGSEDSDYWRPGYHYVTCEIDGEEFGSAVFEIV